MSTMKSKLSAKQQNGNKRRRLNALKHGTFSAGITMLPGEDPREFHHLHSSLIEEWAPESPTEHDAVLDMAKGIWRKARNQKFIAARVEQTTHEPEHRLFDEPRALFGCARLFETLGPEHVDYCLASISKRDAENLRQKFCRANFESESEWIQAMRTEIFSVLLPRSLSRNPLRAPYLDLADPELTVPVLYAASQVITPEVLDQELALEERNTAIIHRAMKRIIECKAMKKVMKQSFANEEGNHRTIQNGKLTES